MESNTINVKAIFAFYIVSIFMLTNGSLFGWAFMGTPLIIWRQIIWVVGLIISFKLLPVFESMELDSVFNVEKRFFFCIVVLSVVTIIVYHFNLLRIAFAFWIYFAGLPFVCFPILVKQSRIVSSQTFYSIFAMFGFFLSIGLIVDYMTGGYFTRRFLIGEAGSLELLGMLESGRYCFLSEAPTIIGVFYTFCMMCGLMRMYESKRLCTKMFYLVMSGSFIIGGWFTGSRQIVLVLVLMYIGGLFFYCLKAEDTKSHIIIAVLISLFSLPSLYTSFMLKDDTYAERYSSESIEQDTRSRAWENGFKHTICDDITITLVGEAVALSQGQKALPGETTGSHYENSFFARISECGIVGLLLLCYPVIYVLRRLQRWDLFQLLLIIILLAYLITCFVSPNGQHQTSQMALFLTLGMYIARDYFDPDYQYE